MGRRELLYSAVEVAMHRNTVVAVALVFLLFSACAPTDTPTAPKETAPAPAAETTAETTADATPNATASTAISVHYLEAATALAADDLQKAKSSLSALAKDSAGELKTLAQAAADTGDIAATRERFKALSAVAISMELPKGYAVALCPMYKGGSKWVQKKEDPLANPYFGKAMLTCASFVN
jgi:hypothetical protein